MNLREALKVLSFRGYRLTNKNVVQLQNLEFDFNSSFMINFSLKYLAHTPWPLPGA
jgi:hypothetical protein